MRILHAIHDFLPRHRAGSEIYAFELAREQSARHDVFVLAAEYDPAAAHATLRWRAVGGLTVIEVVNNWEFRTFEETYGSARINEQLAHALDAVRPDVLHVHNLLNLSFDLPRLASERGAVVAATVHDYTLVCPSGGQRVHVAEQHVCAEIDAARCSRCFVQSPFHAQMAAGRLTRSPGGRSIGRLGLMLRRLAPGAAAVAVRSIGGAAAVSPADIRRRLASARHVFETVDLFVAPSASIGAELVRLGADRRRVEVSDYGFQVPAHQRRAPRANGPIRIGFVGTLVWHKGVHVLLEAARSLRGDFEIHLYGDATVFPEYVATLQRAAAGMSVVFHGGFDRANLPEVYGALDVLVVPSLWPENSPLVIHEAFMHGVAVVAFRTGGIPDLVVDGVNGLLADALLSDSLRAALQRLISDPGLRAQLAAAAPRVKTIAEDGAEWDARYTALRDVDADRHGSTPPVASAPSTGGSGRSRLKRAISIVMPTWNAGTRLDDVLDALEAQDGDFACSVIGVDSGSSDGTMQRLRDRGAMVVEVPAHRFNHGSTRNEGLALATGEFAVLLVQDAVPASSGWLQALVAPLLGDQRVAGTFARQCPAKGASRLTVEHLSRWIAAQPEARIVGPLTPGAYEAMSPAERLAACAFDNVCACVRLEVWRSHPFRHTCIAEDLEWGREVLLAGYKLAYTPDAAVWHSHERPVAYELQRTYLVHQRLHALFGMTTIPSMPALLRAIAATVPANVDLAAQERRGRVRASIRNAALGVAQPLGQYLGARSARDGRRWLPTGRI